MKIKEWLGVWMDTHPAPINPAMNSRIIISSEPDAIC
jgi:hypothetical protein